MNRLLLPSFSSPEEKRAEIYVISWERYETLALCLAGLVGFNSGVGPIHVIDDASTDPRVEHLLARFAARKFLTYEVNESNRGVGVCRRRVVDRFLAGDAEQLVQVEGDMLVAPAAVAALVGAYRRLRASGTEVNWLATHQHDWCHKTLEVVSANGYEIGRARSGSEPFWTTSRDVLQANEGLIPPTRPDLVPFLKCVGATVLRRPEIQAQHLGAINSYYYGTYKGGSGKPVFRPDLVTYKNHDGTMRQPYPWFEIDFARGQEVCERDYLEWAQLLADASPLDMPEITE